MFLDNIDNRKRRILKNVFMISSILSIILFLLYFYLRYLPLSQKYQYYINSTLSNMSKQEILASNDLFKQDIEIVKFSNDSIMKPFLSLKLKDGSYLHYNKGEIFEIIESIPTFFMILVLFMLILQVAMLLIFRNSERGRLLVAMSKEAAHQMGTPLSSIMGWIELLKEFGLTKESKLVYDGLNEDLKRLNVVATRFSNIGTMPKFTYCNLKQLIESVVKYLIERSGKGEKILFNIGVSEVNLFGNSTLLSWAFENIIKNSIEAIYSDKGSGKISIRVEEKKGDIIIDFIDNGPGIVNRSMIFESGYTTKKRGWGVGLVLSKRVIEEIHKGKIFVKHSDLDGTTMRVVIPAS